MANLCNKERTLVVFKPDAVQRGKMLVKFNQI